jgi:hypothetical protein
MVKSQGEQKNIKPTTPENHQPHSKQMGPTISTTLDSQVLLSKIKAAEGHTESNISEITHR